MYFKKYKELRDTFLIAKSDVNFYVARNFDLFIQKCFDDMPNLNCIKFLNNQYNLLDDNNKQIFNIPTEIETFLNDFALHDYRINAKSHYYRFNH
jgi:hypothetical protein